MLPLGARLTWGAAALLLPTPALAHVSGLAHRDPRWTLEPWLVGSLALSLGLYAIGGARLARRSAAGRGALRRRALLFAGGWLTLVAAAASPLHEAGQQSFTLHMIEHELLMLLAAPLLVLSQPLGAMVWAFPAKVRRTLGDLGTRVRGPWRALVAPVTATLIQAAVLWLWHAPGLFDLALTYEPWHVAQHLSFLISALFFWQAMLGPRRSLGLAAVCLFGTSIVTGALGALMAFSESPWYPRYAMLGMAPFGLTPTEDQQLAGLLMWIPGGMVHAGAALALVGVALAASHRSPAGTRRLTCAEQADGGAIAERCELPIIQEQLVD